MSNPPIPTPRLEDTLADTTLLARQDLEVSRHVFAGKVTYVLRDPITFESHKFTKVDYELFVAMNADRPLCEVLDLVVAKQLVDTTEKDEFYRFAANLVQLGLIGLPSPDGKTLFARSKRRVQAVRNGMLKNFLFQQIPLFNPDRFLDRTIHLVRPLFSRSCAVLWCIGALVAIAIVARRWTEFTDPLADMLTLKNAPMLWGILFGLKFFHEFGHSYACKHFGGTVPSMGIYLIAGNPCAFVDASAAWGFPNRMHRILVSLGGMYFESIVAIFAVFVWALSSSPGIQSAAHHIVFMASAVTLLFNANPLMKYDGYFIACDLTGNPNLRQRATKELQRLLKRWLVGVDVEGPKRLSRRGLGLIAYGIASSIYKFFVVIGISCMVATKFAALGLAMSGFYIVSTLYGLYSTAFRYLWTSPEVRPVQTRARICSYALLLGLPLLLLIPIPTTTRSTGLLTTTDEIEIATETAGIVQSVLSTPGQDIERNQPLVVLQNQSLVAASMVGLAKFELTSRTKAVELQVDRTKAAKTSQRMDYLLEKSRQSIQQTDALAVRTKQAGIVMTCLPKNHTGQFLPAGSTVAVIGRGDWQVRCLADAATMLAAQPQVGQSVSLRLTAQANIKLHGKITRIAEMGDRQVRDESLTHLAGGRIPVNPISREASEAFFEILVKIDDDHAKNLTLMHGMTVDVRMYRQTEIIALTLYRRITRFINQVMTG